MKGRNSVVVSMRVDDSVYRILEEMANKKGITVAALIKGKVEEFARLASQSVNKEEYVVVGGVRYKVNVA